ncbi:MAG: methyltransferase [Desulfobacula sp.]|jgi:O-methyltransferase|nr:methyltransferase [Desulfobacula sp.]MBT7259926.1 methyltransferase [Desulfobacula sp.]
MIKKFLKKLVNHAGYDLINKKVMPEVIYSLDDKFNPLYDLAQEKCQMVSTDNFYRRQRHYTLNYLLWSLKSNQGDCCELGCWRGLSAYQIATHMKSLGGKNNFHIFDSFEGLSEYKDIDIVQGVKQDLGQRREQFACSENIVRSNLGKFDFINYYKGWIPDRFNEVKDHQFSFVHIDVDLYQPIFDSFDFFYPRLVQGGIMVFDDYGSTMFPGAKKAVDECLKKHNNCFFLPLPSGQAFLVKN